jgi:hypothetical protein
MIQELNESHIDGVKHLFYENKKVMSSTKAFEPVGNRTEEKVRKYHYNFFCNHYLNNIEGDNSISYGWVTDKVESLIAFDLPMFEPTWYFTMFRGSGDGNVHIPELFERAVRFNESIGRYKFYSCFNAKHAKKTHIRKFVFSDYVNERYDYFDDYIVPAYQKCRYDIHDKYLFFGYTYPIDVVVRCTFLKQEYR